MQLKFRPADVDNDGIQLLLVCRQNNLHAAAVGLGCNKSSQVNKSYLKTRGEDECGECVTVDTYGKRRRRHEIMTWKLTILFLLNLLNEQMNTSAGMWVCGRTYACIHIFYAQFDKRASWKRDLNGRLNERLTDWLTDWLVGWMTKWLSDIPFKHPPNRGVFRVRFSFWFASTEMQWSKPPTGYPPISIIYESVDS